MGGRAQCGNMDDPECLTGEERSTWGALYSTPSPSPQAASAPVQPRLHAQPGDAAAQGRRTLSATAVGLIAGVALLAACVVGARSPVAAACCAAPVWLSSCWLPQCCSYVNLTHLTWAWV